MSEQTFKYKCTCEEYGMVFTYDEIDSDEGSPPCPGCGQKYLVKSLPMVRADGSVGIKVVTYEGNV